jgi:SOS regulatory protein LexA
MDEICQRIKALRTREGLSMTKMAEMIGVSAGNISDWESQKKKSIPTSKALVRISELFQVSLDWLLTGKESESSYIYRASLSKTKSEIISSIHDQLVGLPREDLEVIELFTRRLNKYHLVNESPSRFYQTNRSENGDTRIQENALATQYYVKLPLIGRVTAGSPVTAVENIEEFISVPRSLVTSDKHFVLRVQGESMIKAGIQDGDLIIVRQQETAQNGEIVVVLIGDEDATVKTLYLEKDRVRLQPENDTMMPIYTRDVKVLGKVIGVLKSGTD